MPSISRTCKYKYKYTKTNKDKDKYKYTKTKTNTIASPANEAVSNGENIIRPKLRNPKVIRNKSLSSKRLLFARPVAVAELLSKHLDVPRKEMADSQKNKNEEENTKPKEETFNNAKNLPSDPNDVFEQVKLANL